MLVPSIQQCLMAGTVLVLAYALLYQTSKRQYDSDRRSESNRGPVIGIYIDHTDQVAVSLAIGKHTTRHIFNGHLLRSTTDQGTAAASSDVLSRRADFWNGLKTTDEIAVRATFESLTRVLDDAGVRQARYVGFIIPTQGFLSLEQKRLIENVAVSTGLAETLVFEEVHIAALHSLDLPFHREGLASKVVVATKDGMFVIASPGHDADGRCSGHTELHEKPFSLAEFMASEEDPPSNYNQIFLVESNEGSKADEAVKDPRTPIIRRISPSNVASGAASFVGRHVDIMAFNTYVRIATTISIALRLDEVEDSSSRHTLLKAHEKEGILILDRDTFPETTSTLDVVAFRQNYAEEAIALGAISFPLDKLSGQSKSGLAITGSASWIDGGVFVTIQVLDIQAGVRVFDTYDISSWKRVRNVA